MSEHLDAIERWLQRDDDELLYEPDVPTCGDCWRTAMLTAADVARIFRVPQQFLVVDTSMMFTTNPPEEQQR